MMSRTRRFKPPWTTSGGSAGRPIAGGAHDAPDNTLGAFRHARDLGGSPEADLRTTADSVIICLHDAPALHALLNLGLRWFATDEPRRFFAAARFWQDGCVESGAGSNRRIQPE